MKLRIRDNSVRLRLARQEVTSIASSGRVSASTEFAGGNVLTYSAQIDARQEQISAEFVGGELVVRLPEEMARQWASSEEVGMAAEQALPDGGSLSILVEKDFACLAPREGEDESDMYPHPEQDSETC